MLDIRIIVGRLTKDPEVKEVGSDVKLATFSIACDSDWKNEDGERSTEFVECKAWRGTAGFVENYLEKGRLVAIIGRMETEEWESNKYSDEEGNSAKMRRQTLVIDKIYPLDKPSSSDDKEDAKPKGRNKDGNSGKGGNKPSGKLPNW